MSNVTHTRCLIIGSGPAGYTAAVYTARAGLDPVMVEGLQPGGQLTITTDVENWPGDVNVQGPDLMQRMQRQVDELGVQRVQSFVEQVNFDGHPFEVRDESGHVYIASSAIIATGAQAKWLGVPGEQEFMGRGVSACATCDGFFYRGREVAVIGGGNTAVEEALYLSGLAERVYLIHRRDKLRAEKILQDRIFAKTNVCFTWNSEVEEIVGDEMGVTGIRVKSTEEGKGDISHVIDVHGAFIAIGHKPATEFLDSALNLDPAGYIGAGSRIPQLSVLTDIPGVFAAGDVVDRRYQQAVTAASMGCMAALEAEAFLAEKDAEQATQEIRQDARTLLTERAKAYLPES